MKSSEIVKKALHKADVALYPVDGRLSLSTPLFQE